MKWEDTQSPRILIVDDNPRIHEDFDLVFLDGRSGSPAEADRFEIYEQSERPAVLKPAYELDHALSGGEGVERVQRSLAESRPYQVAFVDIRMPGMDGVETIERIWKIDARIQTVICTAYADYRWEDLARRLGQSDRLLVLKKPFDHIEVVQLASTLTEKWFLARQAALKFEQMEALVAQRTQQLLELQRRETERARELDQIKLKFLSNLSQEFRTPLTLILNGLDQMNIATTDQTHEALVRRNAERLLRLIDESLSQRVLDEDDAQLRAVDADLAAFLQGAVNLFKSIASRQGVQLELHLNKSAWAARFDIGKLEKILFNVLSNSLKSVPASGRIQVHAQFDPKALKLVIEDSGERKSPDGGTQATQEPTRPPSLDLAVSQELARILGGSLNFENLAPGADATRKSPHSRCVITLPLENGGKKQAGPAAETGGTFEEGAAMKEQPLILLAQEWTELTQYLQQGLGSEYRIVEAKDGVQALAQARELVPDVIIAEITLAGVDGVDLCRKLKRDELTSHIPIILLTANDSESSQLRALEAGADEYVVKPFKLPLLKARVDNLMASRAKLHELFSQSGQVSPRDLAINQSDAQFFRRAMDLVEESMADLEFDVETMARKLGVSRRQLFRKIRAAAGCSPNNFIRTLRLKRAARLLKESNLSVTEITYAVGFSDLKYFRTIFREQYGVLPGDYAKSP